MKGRIAHRPHYRLSQPAMQHVSNSQNQYFRCGWVYRRQTLLYEKHSLGYQLFSLPVQHRLMHHLVIHQAYL